MYQNKAAQTPCYCLVIYSNEVKVPVALRISDCSNPRYRHLWLWGLFLQVRIIRSANLFVELVKIELVKMVPTTLIYRSSPIDIVHVTVLRTSLQLAGWVARAGETCTYTEIEDEPTHYRKTQRTAYCHGHCCDDHAQGCCEDH